MKRVFKYLAAASGLALAVTTANAQSIGGFPLREPGSKAASGGTGKAANNKLRSEVVVSQGAGSEVRTIAAAMKMVKPGGSIIVQGGTYSENINVTKPVAIRGVADAYGRNVVFRPAAGAPCVSIAPDTPLASVSLSQMIFEFDARQPSSACIDIHGGTVAVKDTYILPSNSDIPLRAAYGQMRPDMIDHLARPPRDFASNNSRAARVEKYIARHAQPVGADHQGWNTISSGSELETYVHGAKTAGAGIASGPAAGVRVSAGDVRLEGNVIIGARTAVSFDSLDRAMIQGSLTNNVIIGNGVGIAASGVTSDLLITRNTIRFNDFEGVRADVYDGVKILANEIMGNGTGIYLSEKVRQAVVNSNFVVQNDNDAMKVSSGFFGAVAGNTFADNNGCTINFFSAEQKIINDAEIEVVAFRDFEPGVIYEPTNFAIDNDGDERIAKKRRRGKDRKKLDPETMLASCGR